MSKKCVLITGATSGIGKAYAQRFAKEGYNLILTGRRKEKIHAFAKELEKEYHVHVETTIVELSNHKEVDEMIQYVMDKRIDILVNNAGFGANNLFHEEDLSILEKMVDVHILATMKLTHAVLPGMILRGEGTIINISSESAFLLIPKNATYSGTKAFLKNFTESLYLDLMDTGVKVQVVCPGFTRTDFHEKMGMDKSRQTDHGLMKWMSPDQVVDIAMRDLAKNKVVCIPGKYTRMLINLFNLFPRRFYYKFMHDFSCKNFNKNSGIETNT